MRGTIQLIGPRQILIGVETDDWDFSILELVGGYCPELGDIIAGPLDDRSTEAVKNLTQGEKWDVVIHDTQHSKQSAWRIISRH